MGGRYENDDIRIGKAKEQFCKTVIFSYSGQGWKKEKKNAKYENERVERRQHGRKGYIAK